MTKLFTQKTNNRTRTYLGTMTVTPENVKRLENFRQALREIGKSVIVRGRNPNRKHVAHCTGNCPTRFRQDIPLRYATSFDVYWRS